MKAEV